MQRLLMMLPGCLRLALLCAGLIVCSGAQAQIDIEPRVPYVPTPQDVVDRMLAMAGMTTQDYLIDLGSGDGRIVITAAEKFGTRGFGVDLNPVRISEANDSARKSGVTDKVAFYQRNLFVTDLSQATVITMYLLPEVNLELRPKLLELKPGTRLVSHDFDMGDWKPDRHVRMGVNDKYAGADGESDIYFWVVPANMGGSWRSRLEVAGKPQTYEFSFAQQYQVLSGSARVNGRAVAVQGATLRGTELSFSFVTEVNGAPVKHGFTGRVNGDRIFGQVMLSGARLAASVEWVAERVGRLAILAPGVVSIETGY